MQTAPITRTELHPRIAAFIKGETPPTPCMILVLDVVEERYRQLAAALPNATVFYAVKANPEREVVGLLAQLGASFDVAISFATCVCQSAMSTATSSARAAAAAFRPADTLIAFA